MTVLPVLCILGAGSNVGASVARLFASKGYQVATISRTREEEVVNGQLQIQCDLSEPSSVAGAFAAVRQSLGIPSVVVYNASAGSREDKNDPTSLPFSALSRDLMINTVSVLAAAHEAVKGFRELPSDTHKTFIYTGNVLNTTRIPGFLSLGMGKTASSQLIATCAEAYKCDDFDFFYADERKANGDPMYNEIQGDGHAKMYWELAAREGQVPWYATFVSGVGYKDFSITKA